MVTVQDGGSAPDGVVVTSRAFETFLPQCPVILAIAVALFTFCAIVNLLGCYLLLPEVRDELRSFRAGRKGGTITEVPVAERATT